MNSIPFGSKSIFSAVHFPLNSTDGFRILEMVLVRPTATYLTKLPIYVAYNVLHHLFTLIKAIIEGKFFLRNIQRTTTINIRLFGYRNTKRDWQARKRAFLLAMDYICLQDLFLYIFFAGRQISLEADNAIRSHSLICIETNFQ